MILKSLNLTTKKKQNAITWILHQLGIVVQNMIDAV